MAALRELVPVLGVYFVWPESMAALAASQTAAGVGKSGCPTDRLMTYTAEASRDAIALAKIKHSIRNSHGPTWL